MTEFRLHESIFLSAHLDLARETAVIYGEKQSAEIFLFFFSSRSASLAHSLAIEIRSRVASQVIASFLLLTCCMVWFGLLAFNYTYMTTSRCWSHVECAFPLLIFVKAERRLHIAEHVRENRQLEFNFHFFSSLSFLPCIAFCFCFDIACTARSIRQERREEKNIYERQRLRM